MHRIDQEEPVTRIYEKNWEKTKLATEKKTDSVGWSGRKPDVNGCRVALIIGQSWEKIACPRSF